MPTPFTYQGLIKQLKEEIHSARIKASLSTNVHLLVLYWKIGTAILQNQQAEGWGAKIIDQLAKDLKSAFPDMSGISPRNLKYMRAFAAAYPHFVQPAIAHITAADSSLNDKDGLQAKMQAALAPFNTNEFVQAVLAQIPWYHHITLLDKVKDLEERLYYIQQAADNGWSRNVLVHQVESKLYQRKVRPLPTLKQRCHNRKAILPVKY